MTGIRLLHRVSGEKPDGVDRHLLQFRLPHLLLSGRPLRPANPPATVVWCASTLKQERISSACSHAGLRIRNRLDARRWGAAGTRGTGALRDPPASDGVLGSRGDGALRRTGRLPPDSSQRPAAGDGGADRGRRPPGWAGSSAAGTPQVASHDVGADGPAPPRVGWGVPTPRAGDPAGPGRPRAGTGPDREVARPWDRLPGESRWPAEQRRARGPCPRAGGASARAGSTLVTSRRGPGLGRRVFRRRKLAQHEATAVRCFQRERVAGPAVERVDDEAIVTQVAGVLGVREQRYAAGFTERNVEAGKHGIASAQHGIGAAAASPADQEGEAGAGLELRPYSRQQAQGAR